MKNKRFLKCKKKLLKLNGQQKEMIKYSGATISFMVFLIILFVLDVVFAFIKSLLG